MFIRAYLRASTKEQDAERAKQSLIDFAESKGHKIAAFYTENVSGAKLERPELNRLLQDASKGDGILLEQVDRLSRLKDNEWQELKNRIKEKDLSIVALDLPTSHLALDPAIGEEFTGSMLRAVNTMLLDMLAAVSRKDYEDRKRRQKQGIERNKEKFKGKQADHAKHQKILELRSKGYSLNEVAKLADTSKATVCRVLKSKN